MITQLFVTVEEESSIPRGKLEASLGGGLLEAERMKVLGSENGVMLEVTEFQARNFLRRKKAKETLPGR